MFVCLLCFLVKKKSENQSQKQSIHPTSINTTKNIKNKVQTNKESHFMTILHILQKKKCHQNITLKRRPLSSKTLIKRRKFFYINRQIFVSHRVFLHRMRLYLQGKTNEFDSESLNRKAFMQYRALSYHKNQGGKINPNFFPNICITYNAAREVPPTPEREEIEFVPFVTQSFY